METDYSMKKDIARKHLLKVAEKMSGALSNAGKSYGTGFAAKLENLARAGTRKAFSEIAADDAKFIDGIKIAGKIYREEVPLTPYAKDIPSVWKHNILKSYSPKDSAVEYAMAIDLFESLFEEETFGKTQKAKEQETMEYISKTGEKLENAVGASIKSSGLTAEQLSYYLEASLLKEAPDPVSQIRAHAPKFDVFYEGVIGEFSSILKGVPEQDVISVGRVVDSIKKDGSGHGNRRFCIPNFNLIIDSLRKHRPKSHRMIYDQTIDMVETGFLGGKTGMEEE